jgi:hypothetical protein
MFSSAATATGTMNRRCNDYIVGLGPVGSASAHDSTAAQ